MSSDIDYSAVDIPTEKRPTEYSYAERRAELLQLVFEAGHPRAINQTELAERYGVCQQQISKDMDRLAEYVDEHVGDRHRFVVDSVLQGAMLALVEEGEHYRAAQVARWWGEWLGDIGAVEQTPTEVEHGGGISVGGGLDEETKAMMSYITRGAGNEACEVTTDGARDEWDPDEYR